MLRWGDDEHTRRAAQERATIGVDGESPRPDAGDANVERGAATGLPRTRTRVARAAASAVFSVLMPDLAAQVERLLQITRGPTRAKDQDLGAAVHALMGAYDPGDVKGTKRALRLLDAGLLKAKDGRTQQILRLALGALVEAGAPPDLAWPTAERGLLEALKLAGRFADACLDAEDTPSITEAVKRAGPRLASKLPREHAAWESLRSRALLAVACISHAPKLRARIQKSRPDLCEAVSPLAEAVEELLFLSQIMQVLPDQTMLAIHPGQRRGFRVEVREIATNLELFVLLAAAIVGDPKKGLLEGRRPSAKAIAALIDPDHAPKKPPEVRLPWHLSSWTALRPDGTLPDPNDQRSKNWIWFEGVPHDLVPFEGERVLLFQKPLMPRTLEVEASFETLSPRVTLKSKLTGAEVDNLLRRMGKAAAKVEAKAAAKEAADRAKAQKRGGPAARPAKARRGRAKG